jgi:hypothetical protein
MSSTNSDDTIDSCVDPDRSPDPTADALAALVAASIAAVDGATGAVIVAAVEGRDGAGVDVSVSSDDRARALAAAERDGADGPSTAARAAGEINRISSAAVPGPWPEFRAACIEHDIMSTASFPLVVDGTVRGCLTLYSDDHHAFDAPAIRTGRQLAAHAAALVGAAD